MVEGHEDARTDRVAIVTGGAGGIGAAVAYRLAAMGLRILVADVQDGAAVAGEIVARGGVARAALLDVGDGAAVEQLVAAEERVDVLVNAHGIGGGLAPLERLSEQEWQQILDVNLTGTFRTCRAAVPRMRTAGWGRIVNVASVAGKEGNPNTSAYSASKAGVIGLTKTLAREVAMDGVIVNCVTPGVIDTPMVDERSEGLRDYILARTPLQRMGRPEEVAELIAWLCSDACSFSTGAIFDVSGGRASY